MCSVRARLLLCFSAGMLKFSLQPDCLFFYFAGVAIVDFLAGMLMCAQSEPECNCAFQLEC